MASSIETYVARAPERPDCIRACCIVMARQRHIFRAFVDIHANIFNVVEAVIAWAQKRSRCVHAVRVLSTIVCFGRALVHIVTRWKAISFIAPCARTTVRPFAIRTHSVVMTAMSSQRTFINIWTSVSSIPCIALTFKWPKCIRTSRCFRAGVRRIFALIHVPALHAMCLKSGQANTLITPGVVNAIAIFASSRHVALVDVCACAVDFFIAQPAITLIWPMCVLTSRSFCRAVVRPEFTLIDVVALHAITTKSWRARTRVAPSVVCAKGIRMASSFHRTLIDVFTCTVDLFISRVAFAVEWAVRVRAIRVHTASLRILAAFVDICAVFAVFLVPSITLTFERADFVLASAFFRAIMISFANAFIKIWFREGGGRGGVGVVNIRALTLPCFQTDQTTSITFFSGAYVTLCNLFYNANSCLR